MYVQRLYVVMLALSASIGWHAIGSTEHAASPDRGQTPVGPARPEEQRKVREILQEGLSRLEATQQHLEQWLQERIEQIEERQQSLETLKASIDRIE